MKRVALLALAWAAALFVFLATGCGPKCTRGHTERRWHAARITLIPCGKTLVTIPIGGHYDNVFVCDQRAAR